MGRATHIKFIWILHATSFDSIARAICSIVFSKLRWLPLVCGIYCGTLKSNIAVGSLPRGKRGLTKLYLKVHVLLSLLLWTLHLILMPQIKLGVGDNFRHATKCDTWYVQWLSSFEHGNKCSALFYRCLVKLPRYEVQVPNVRIANAHVDK